METLLSVYQVEKVLQLRVHRALVVRKVHVDLRVQKVLPHQKVLRVSKDLQPSLETR